MPKKKTKTPSRPAPTSAERIAWLLNFLQDNVATMRTGAYLDLSMDVAYFLFDARAALRSTEPFYGDETDDLALVRELAHEREAEREAMRRTPAQPQPDYLTGREALGTEGWDENDLAAIPRATLLELQTWLRAGLNELHAGRAWTPFPDSPRPAFALQPEADGTLARAYSGPKVLPILKLSAIDLIVQWWPQLRRCKNEYCGITFIPTHGRQWFHHPSCSDVVRQRRHRDNRDYTAEEARRAQREFDRKATTKKGRTR